VAGNVNRERLPVVPAATPATAGQRTLYVRHPGDVIRFALGAVLVAACSMVAALESVSGVETGLFHAVNSLPSWLYGPLWLVMQLGSFGAIFAVAALAALLRRFRLALELLAAGLLAYYSAKGLKDLVDRARPAALINDVIVRGPASHGLGYPSGHAAVSFALAATAVPFLARRWRRVIWALPLTVGFARVFVGAHLSLDVAGGFALGWTVGALVHLVAGAPSGRVTPGPGAGGAAAGRDRRGGRAPGESGRARVNPVLRRDRPGRHGVRQGGRSRPARRRHAVQAVALDRLPEPG